MGSQAINSRDAEPTAVLVALRKIVRFLRLAEREAEVTHALSAAQLFVLHRLAEAPARSLAELAARTLTDQSSVSTVVTKLAAKRLVTRKPSAADRRRTELRLTTAGERIVRASPHVAQAHIIDAIRAMSARRRVELIRALEGLATAIGAGDVEPRMLFEDEAPRRRKVRR